MPPKIKFLWVLCIVVVFFGFVYFSFMGKMDETRQKAELKTKQQSLMKEKLNATQTEGKGRTFKTDPIKEIKELNALGKYDEAVKYAEGVATLNPDQPKIYTWWGISLVKSGKNEEAIKKFIKSSNLDAAYSKTYLYWGLTLAMDGKSEEAIDKYKKVIELDSENSNAYAYWGAALEQLNQHANAVEKLERALEIRPKNTNVFGTLIDALFHLKRYREAWEAVKKAREVKVIIPENSLNRLAEVFPEPTV